MTTWLDDRVRELRLRLDRRDEGSLWLLFLDGPSGAVVVASAVDGAMTGMDADLRNNLVSIVRDVRAAAVLLAVPRAEGRPQRADRALWRVMERGCASTTELVDLVVVGTDNYWSARRETQ